MNTLLAVALAIVVALVVAVGAFAAIGPESVWERVAGPADQGPADFTSLRRRPAPNDALACSPGLCEALMVDVPLPTYPEPPEALLQRLDAVVRADPDVKRVDDGQKPTYRRYVARTPVLRFPDTIDAEAVEGEAGTGLRLYSRSLLGRGDFGTNKARLKSWTSRARGSRGGRGGPPVPLTPATQAASRRNSPAFGSQGTDRNMVPKPAVALLSYPPRPAIGKGTAMNALGERLQFALGVRGLRKQMAFAVELGVNESTVSRWQRGYGLSVANVVRVCEALDISIDWLLTGRGSMQLDRSGASGPSDRRLQDACAGLPESVVSKLCETAEAIQAAIILGR